MVRLTTAALFGRIGLKVDRLEIEIGAHEIALAFRKADSFEPEAGQADLRHFATRRALALVFAAGAEQAHDEDMRI